MIKSVASRKIGGYAFKRVNVFYIFFLLCAKPDRIRRPFLPVCKYAGYYIKMLINICFVFNKIN
jgi:hypothetical protein